jgi:hypothetical protein
MILFKNDYPIGLLTIDTINSEIMPFWITMKEMMFNSISD